MPNANDTPSVRQAFAELEQRCADGRPCEHVVCLIAAGETGIHVLGLPEHGYRLLEHAQQLAAAHGYGTRDDPA